MNGTSGAGPRKAVRFERRDRQTGAMESDQAHIFESSVGDWWAECLLCGEWVSTNNDSRRSAEEKFGRHLQNDQHPPTCPAE